MEPDDWRRAQILFPSAAAERFPGVKLETDLRKRLQYMLPEIRLMPEIKNYLRYRENGRKARETGNVIDGVKDLWTLDNLEYIEHVLWLTDPMHTFTNIIKDSIQLLKPCKKNRTRLPDVRNTMSQYPIFPHLSQKSSHGGYIFEAGWIFSKEEIKNCNSYVNEFGRISARIKNPIDNDGGKFSHSKLQYAIKYAEKNLRGKGDAAVTNNILDLFNIIGRLWQHSITRSNHDILLKDLYNTLANREGLLPPSELTYALHGIIHVAQQVKEAGPSRYCALFTYERANKRLKGLIKNPRDAIASMAKNYLLSEISIFSSGINLKKLKIIQELCDGLGSDIAPKFRIGYNGMNKLNYDEVSKKITYIGDEEGGENIAEVSFENVKDDEIDDGDRNILPNDNIIAFLKLERST